MDDIMLKGKKKKKKKGMTVKQRRCQRWMEDKEGTVERRCHISHHLARVSLSLSLSLTRAHRWAVLRPCLGQRFDGQQSLVRQPKVEARAKGRLKRLGGIRLTDARSIIKEGDVTVN